jgi:hypothetical protein
VVVQLSDQYLHHPDRWNIVTLLLQAAAATDYHDLPASVFFAEALDINSCFRALHSTPSVQVFNGVRAHGKVVSSEVTVKILPMSYKTPWRRVSLSIARSTSYHRHNVAMFTGNFDVASV